MVYGAVYEASLDATFRAAEAHGIRAVIGKVMMDRLTYDPTIDPSAILERSLRESAGLIERWHGRDDGRLRYAVTPRFAVSCTADMLRESAALAASTGTYWQTHVSEDRAEIAEVARLFPDALDYVDVYDRAGGLGQPSDPGPCRPPVRPGAGATRRERDARRPLPGLEPVPGVRRRCRSAATWRPACRVGLGSDVSGGPDLSIFTEMRVGFYAQNALRVAGRSGGSRRSAPLDWLRMGTLGGAEALGLADEIGSLEAGKAADLIAVDPSYVGVRARGRRRRSRRTS